MEKKFGKQKQEPLSFKNCFCPLFSEIPLFLSLPFIERVKRRHQLNARKKRSPIFPNYEALFCQLVKRNGN